MTIYKPTALEWLTLMFMFPIILFTTGYQLFGSRFFTEIKVFAYASSLILLISLLMWYICFNIIFIISGLYPFVRHMWVRLLLLIVLDILIVTGNMALVFYGFDRFHVLGYQLNHESFIFSTAIGFVVTVIGITLCETEYTFKKWKESLAVKELAELQYLQQEFENLIRQINPHFLFNNLNALSSLIGTDPLKAEYFLDELSKVYRYLMRNNEEGISSLSSEMRFIYSYMELLKIRYNESVFLIDKTTRDFDDYLLPSLSLQLLVENAVKHNIVRKNQPLYIKISIDEQRRLVVENNLQKKSAAATSNQVGLSNIAVKYKMLNQPGVIVDQDHEFFRVKLPLFRTVSSDGRFPIIPDLLVL